MSYGIENNMEIANKALIYTCFTNAKTSFCLAPDSGEDGEATGLDYLPGGSQLKALFGVSRGLLAHDHLDAGFASLIPVSIIREAWTYQKC